MSSRRRPPFRIQDPVHFLALGFGSGLAPKAPGTVGTVAAIPVYLLVSGLPLGAYLAVTALAFVAGIWICDKASRDAGVHDHGAIVWDEIVGYLVTMAAAPSGAGWVLLGFVLFRLFDVLKPWPVSWLDRKLAGGLGIMVDDLVAGVMAWVPLQVLAWLL